MPNLNELKNLISSLSQADKQELIASLSSSENVVNSSADTFQEARFSNGLFCSKCGCAENIVKYGQYNGKQRYLCKNCHSTFTMTSNSILHGTRKSLAIWEKYLECLLNGFSLKKTAKICGISIPTAFYWRHKILDALKKRENKKLQGIIESDETYFLLSYKGQKKGLPRKSKKRGTPARKRGLSNEQVCVPCGVDRTGNILSGISNLGKISTQDLNRFYSDKVSPKAIFCTDSEKSYIKFARDNDFRLIQIERGKHKKGIYHINHINAYHANLKSFIDKFKGVATKYLENYLTWNLIRKMSTLEILKVMGNTILNVTNMDIKNRKIPITT